MTKEEREIAIKKLIAARNIKDEQIKLLELESKELDKQIQDLTWIKMSWSELEEWLKTNKSNPADYENNPLVKSKWDVEHNSPSNYCFIRKDGKLQIGAWEHTNGFPHGCDLYVRYDFKAWRPTRF